MALLNARTVDGFQMEKRYLHPEGTVVWINMTIARASAADEAHPRHLCMIEDITARKRAAEEKARLEGQLHQAQKMESVGRLAGGVAHDFNNMLAVILGHGELVRDRLEPTSALRENMGELLEATQRSAALTRQLLAFARKQAVVPLVLDLNDSVASILTMLGRLLGANIQLAWLPGANVGPVYMDASQLDQVLTNLCVNARDAISGVGKLTVATRSVALDAQQCESHPGLVPGDYVRLTVRDDGSGMDKETQSHLFEPFFTTKGVGEGTGLGLATVHGIVTQNHGVIDVESELGHGTTFTILLPRHDGMAGHAAARVAALTVRGHETILVVEDEPSILRVTKTMLEQMGYVVLTAGTPAEALRQAEQHGPEIHLLLTDVVMPEMSGPDLAKKLLSLHPHLKALFMSGFPAHLNAQRGLLENGDFLQKPFSNAELAARMRQALDARSKPS
jgi:signal transduction histidine kinase/ActR/RegA family two-component response regulator